MWLGKEVWITSFFCFTNHKIENESFINYEQLWMYKMASETVTIPKKEYERLKMRAKVDTELLQDIARGIKDILTGNVKEV